MIKKKKRHLSPCRCSHRTWTCSTSPAWRCCAVPRVRFFVFKQKTAYEMLSGDWSSDVCSSDLLYNGGQPEDMERLRHDPGAIEWQIGRASCRERVSLTVEHSVVAVDKDKQE